MSSVSITSLFSCILSAEIVVGLERTEYTVNEGEGPVRVCTILMEGTISRPFTVLFSADDPGTATRMFCVHTHSS